MDNFLLNILSIFHEFHLNFKEITAPGYPRTAKINEKPSEYHAGYVLEPRVNAGGRVGESTLGARLLSTNDIDEARYIANQLDHFNNERKKLESIVFNDALSIAESGEKDNPILIIEGDRWH